jgi:hypothetical protein
MPVRQGRRGFQHRAGAVPVAGGDCLHKRKQGGVGAGHAGILLYCKRLYKSGKPGVSL